MELCDLSKEVQWESFPAKHGKLECFQVKATRGKSYTCRMPRVRKASSEIEPWELNWVRLSFTVIRLSFPAQHWRQDSGLDYDALSENPKYEPKLVKMNKKFLIRTIPVFLTLAKFSEKPKSFRPAGNVTGGPWPNSWCLKMWQHYMITFSRSFA